MNYNNFMADNNPNLNGNVQNGLNLNMNNNNSDMFEIEPRQLNKAP